MAAPCHWLFKSEPDDYSIYDFSRQGVTMWDGIRSWQVRKFFRDQIAPGHKFVFYHSSCRRPAAVGLGEVTGPAEPDQLQFCPDSRYHDPAARPDDPRWLAVPVKFVAIALHEYPLERMRSNRRLAGCQLLTRSRLSVVPLSEAHWQEIVKAMKLAA